ncbi:hypothetical protein J23TS9_45400 [Paenibacillus sp. J23TS9]|uniref:ferritin-like domain-containing protein n=1 Tax=Paenibacillus sp. J23TS9 TaxID=2807193 RepID=UPI001B00BEF6|nr:ferritin-like domain-containing protein [Paenibacillus sp. J23TS9]GIP29410.1 hypothetical protein J23TS9_45400 [Paenibacillus sp. J23TS9]
MKNTSKWVQYFASNNQNLKYIHWDDNYKLTTKERETVIKSIQQFQLGENSEGKHLIKRAQEYVQKTKDEDYYLALIEFIKEEQRHARDLGRFMRAQGIPPLRKHWVDNIFRRFRRNASLEQSIIVLVTAEIIAKIYYKALQKSTKSKVLIDLCDQILCDEGKHVQFQSETLHKLSQNRSAFFNRIVYILRRCLFEGTLIIVWYQHKPVFKAGGYKLKSYYYECRYEFNLTKELIANS